MTELEQLAKKWGISEAELEEPEGNLEVMVPIPSGQQARVIDLAEAPGGDPEILEHVLTTWTKDGAPVVKMADLSADDWAGLGVTQPPTRAALVDWQIRHDWQASGGSLDDLTPEIITDLKGVYK